MAQSLPLLRALRPSVYLRRRALRHGLFGSSMLWRTVAIVILGKGTLKKTFGKQPDRLGRRRITAGHVLTVAVATPMTRKQRKRTGINRKSLEAAARAELEGARQAS